MIAYFEVTICNIGQRGDLSIGLSGTDFPQNKLPGMTNNSIGYTSDGRVYAGKKALPQVRLPLIGTGDVVGCGIDSLHDRVFFTLNGQLLESTPYAKELVIPTVGLHSLNQQVICNFGDQPYSFDVASLVRKHQTEQLDEIYA